jgi:hypothetical protein
VKVGAIFRFAVVVAFAVLVSASVAESQVTAVRASGAEGRRVAAAVEPAFGKPTTEWKLTIVLYPICISSADDHFAFVTANPIQRSGGVVAQPGYFYARRIGSAYHRLDPLLTARTSLRRPAEVPVAVYRDFGIGTKRLCGFQGPEAVKRVLRDHSAPSFRR